jgi:hypothetical protein
MTLATATGEASLATPGKTMLVIAGMHRSGTSALARSCNLLGVDLGSAFIPEQPDNASGFWEDAGIKDADDLALASHGLLWDDVRPLPEPWRDGFGGEEVRVRLRSTLAELAERSALGGVKDPRISRLLPVWLPILEDLGVTPVFLIALRDPAEVASSLARREQLTPARSHLLWLRYTLEAELHTRGHRRWFVSFDDLLGDWRGTLARAAKELGIRFPVSFDAAAPAIDTFLDPALRHHVTDETRACAGVERWTSDAYATLLRMRDDDGPAERGELDRIRARVAAGDVALASVVAELEDEIATLRSGGGADESPDGGRSARERELDRARREALLAHELVGHRDREVQASAAALAAERAERAALLRQIEALTALNEAANHALASRAAEIAAGERARAKLSAALDQQRAETAAATQKIHEILTSQSWRLTEPLRALSAKLRRRRGA